MIPASYRASLGYLLRHPWQLALAAIGVAIGVAVIVAVDLANASARKAFLLSMDAVTGEATHQVIGGPRGLDESVYTALRIDSGLREIAPVVSGDVDIGNTRLTLLGIDLFAEQSLRRFTRDAEAPGNDDDTESLFRAFLTAPGAATLSRATAARLGIETGGRFSVSAAGRHHQATLVGIFDDANVDNLIVTDIATAQAWLDSRGLLTRIDVRIDPGDPRAAERVAATLPPGARLLTAAGRTRTTADLSAAFMTNLSAMSLLALFVGLFLIYNSINFSVLQRRKLIGSLRALGMTRRELVTLLLGEATLIGIAASMLGLVFGIWLGEGLLAMVSQSITDFYFRVNATDVNVSFVSLAKGLVAGVGAALCAAAIPAIEATGYQPRLAMMRSALEHRTSRFLPVAAALGVATMLLAVLVLAISGRSLVAGLAAVFMLILGFAFCVPLAVSSAARFVAPLANRGGAAVVRLALAGIRGSMSRTGVAIVALSVAVSATIGVSVMVDSFRGSVSLWLEQSLQADVYAGVERGSIDAQLVDDIASLDQVAEVSTRRRAWLETGDGRTQLIAVRMSPGAYAGTELLDADPASVWPAWESEDVVLVSEPYAYQNSVTVGDTVRLRTAAGDRDFRIAASYLSYDTNAAAVLLSRATYDRHWDDTGVDALGLYLREGINPDAFVARVLSIAEGRQALRVNSNAKIREFSLEIFDRTFIITDVLYILALGVAVIGILGAMLALQLERARELAVLRALGMTPMQLGGMITGQTAAVGFASGIAAVPLGLVMAWVLIEVINRRAFGWQIDMTLAPGMLVSAIALATSAALLAGLYPAWHAARTEPARAMREE